MPESLIQAAPDSSGKKVHTWQRTIGANNVEDEFTIPGEYPYASYSVDSGNVSAATAASHLLQVMAGASLPVRIRRIRIEQFANATTGAAMALSITRLSTAGTGGTAVTPRPFDTTDAAAGATAMTLPTVKGTETVSIFEMVLTMRQTVAAAGTQPDDFWEWTQLPNTKPIIIPAGAANGICIKNGTAIAAGTVIVTVELVETNFV